jgi:starvation-inducible DNA-binding protein
MKPNIDLAEGDLKNVATLLNALLADEYVLYTKTQHSHWNVQGPNFMELHKFFEFQYSALALVVDEVAERIRVLGQMAKGSLKDFLAVTHLKEDTGDFTEQKKLIQDLIKDHETIIRSIRTDIVPVTDKCKDIGSTDFITKLAGQHETMAWMLRAYIS